MTTKMPESGWELPENKAITSLMSSLATQIDKASETQLLQRLKDWDKGQRDQSKELTTEQKYERAAQANLAKGMLPEKFHAWIDTKFNPIVQQEQQDTQRELSDKRYESNIKNIIKHLQVVGGLEEENARDFAQEFIRPLIGDKALSPDETRAFLDMNPQMQAMDKFLRRLKSYPGKEHGLITGTLGGNLKQDRQNLDALIDEGKAFAEGNPRRLEAIYRILTRKSPTFGDAYIAARLFDSGSGAAKEMPSRLSVEDVGAWIEKFKARGLNAPEAKALLMLEFNNLTKGGPPAARTADIQEIISEFFTPTESELAQDVETVGTKHYSKGVGAIFDTAMPGLHSIKQILSLLKRGKK